MDTYEKFEAVGALIGLNIQEIMLLSNYFSVDELEDFTEYLMKEYDIEEEDL